MKRDLDLMRQIMLAIEQTNEIPAFTGISQIAQVIESDKYLDIAYNLELLAEAGMIDAKFHNIIGSRIPMVLVKRLTMDGHDFLDNIRSNNIWNKTKSKIADICDSASLDVVAKLATKIISTQLDI